MLNSCTNIAETPQGLLALVVSKPKSTVGNGRSHQRQNQLGTKCLKPTGVSPYVQKAFEEEVARVMTAAEGARNDTLNTAALKLGHYVGGGELDQSEVEQALMKAALASGLDEAEATRTIASGLGKGISEPKTTPARRALHRVASYHNNNEAVSSVQLTSEEIRQAAEEGEQGAAALYAALFKWKLVYDHAEHRWYYYLGHAWFPDLIANAYARVDDVQYIFKQEYFLVADEIKSLQARTAQINLDLVDNPDAGNQAASVHKEQIKKLERVQKNLRKAIKTLQQSYHRENVVKLATQGENGLGINGEEWDKVKNILACNNGIIDLKTGMLLPGNPADFIRTAVPHDYLPDAQCPEFEKFLSCIMNRDDEMIRFIKRLFGYIIAGNPVEHVLPVFYGTGRNGKTVLAETIAYVLGDLAWAVRAEFFLDSGRFGTADAPSTSVLSLKGKRYVYGSEPGENRSLDMAKVKIMTGGDRLTGRALYAKHEINFHATHVPVLLANDKPAANAADEALWARLLLIEFPIRFVYDPQKPNERLRDNDLGERLKTEAPGILRWLVEGYREWREHGLQVPAMVRAATLGYRTEADVVLQFVDDKCERVAGYEEFFKILYEAYKLWSREMRVNTTWSANKFSRLLVRHFSKGKDKNNGVIFRGLKVDSGNHQIECAQEKYARAKSIFEEAERLEAKAIEANEYIEQVNAKTAVFNQEMNIGRTSTK